MSARGPHPRRRSGSDPSDSRAAPSAPSENEGSAETLPFAELLALVHDLRAPLAVISGYLALLREGTFGAAPDAWERPLRVLATKAEETRTLLEDVLLTANLDGGRIPVQWQTVDLAVVAQSALERSWPRTSLLNGAMEITVPPEPVVVHADPRHLARILDNLINNALLHSGAEPRVELNVIAGEHPAVTVRDHGPGIPPDRRESILRERSVAPLDAAGAGLGLAIAARLAERTGGTLTLERSEPAFGTEFSLRLAAPA